VAAIFGGKLFGLSVLLAGAAPVVGSVQANSAFHPSRVGK